MSREKRRIEIHCFTAEDVARNTLAAIRVRFPKRHVGFSDLGRRHNYWIVASDCTRDEFSVASDLGAQVAYQWRGSTTTSDDPTSGLYKPESETDALYRALTGRPYARAAK